MTDIVKPVILETDGVFGQLRDGGIINAGGTSNSSFTVNGRGLLFADGTSTAPGGTGTISLQSVYGSSPTVNGAASIQLSSDKDLVVSNTTDTAQFRIDSATGDVTITGNLIVQGTSSTINSTVTDSDHWLISPNASTTTALKIEPDAGVTPIVDLISIRRIFGAAPVFRMDSGGNLYSTKNLTISGLINGVDIVAVKSTLDNHLAGTPGYRHPATDIDVIPSIAGLSGANNVQEALEALNTKIAGTQTSSNVRGFEYIESTTSLSWTVTHNLSSFRIQTTVYDSSWEVIVPNHIKIIDNNTILISFSSAISGRAMILAF